MLTDITTQEPHFLVSNNEANYIDYSKQFDYFTNLNVNIKSYYSAAS